MGTLEWRCCSLKNDAAASTKQHTCSCSESTVVAKVSLLQSITAMLHMMASINDCMSAMLFTGTTILRCKIRRYNNHAKQEDIIISRIDISTVKNLK